jgi:DNA-binding beta-propeller fold protein YncE
VIVICRVVRTLLAAIIVGGVAVGGAARADSHRPLLWQTNSEGNDIHIFDLSSGALVKRLEVGPQPHGLAATADHRTVFVTLEANGQAKGELLWIDAASFQITRRVALCPEPHALATTPDGAFLYVPCRDGRYWIIDGTTGAVIETINTGGRPHNAAVSADGAYAYLSPMYEPRAVTVVDIRAGHRTLGTIGFADSVRPSALSRDGRWLFHHVDGINGFEVADTGTRSVIATIQHSTPLNGVLLVPRLGRLGFGGFERCHGIAVRPGSEEIWSVCAGTVTVHAMESPTFAEVATIALPSKGYWITFSPDGRYACVALADAGEVAVIDTGSRSVVRRLKAGTGPKRNLVLHAS